MTNSSKFRFNWEIVSTIIIALLIGMLLGLFYQSKYCLGLRLKIHDFHLKLNPDIEKDSQTLIIDKVTKDTPKLPQNSIFEEPEKKENNVIILIKKVLIRKKNVEPNIHNYILN